MIRYCGFLDAPRRSPVIYFIISYDVMYIGETQIHPIDRWHSHLSSDGSFRRNVEKKGDCEINYFNKLMFFAYSCTSIVDTFPEVRWKITTQAVEHEVHCYVLQCPSKIGKRFTVISDTTSTAPSDFNAWDFAKDLSIEIIDALAKVLEQ
jgi:hypothetical protein